MMIRERQEGARTPDPVNRTMDGVIGYRLNLSSATGNYNIYLGLVKGLC